jgi:hypothetical protein
MSLWEKVNRQIIENKFESDCREYLQWDADQGMIRGRIELIVPKLNEVFESIAKSKHKKIASWLKEQNEKIAKESALLLEMGQMTHEALQGV